LLGDVDVGQGWAARKVNGLGGSCVVQGKCGVGGYCDSLAGEVHETWCWRICLEIGIGCTNFSCQSLKSSISMSGKSARLMQISLNEIV
jgi:hypothetical protein